MSERSPALRILGALALLGAMTLCGWLSFLIIRELIRGNREVWLILLAILALPELLFFTLMSLIGAIGVAIDDF